MKLKLCRIFLGRVRCPGQVVLVLEEGEDSVLRRYKDSAGEHRTSSDFPVKPDDSGLCYFHLKKKEGFFERRYPLLRKEKNHA